MVALDLPAILTLGRSFAAYAAFVSAIQIPFRRSNRPAASTEEQTHAPAPPNPPLQEGRTYLAHELGDAYRAFSELVKEGRDGMLVTSPGTSDMRLQYGLQDTRTLLLGDSAGKDVDGAGDLLGLSLAVKGFLDKAARPVVMLEGVEYLADYNGFGPVLRLINGLCEADATKRGILILCVLPNSLSERDEALLKSETTPLPSPSGK